MLNRRLKMTLMAACAALTIPVAAHAQWWQRHPQYVHAMSDLRMAYWLVAHRDDRDSFANSKERKALKEIGRAYQDLKNAAIADDRDIYDQPPADMDFYDRRGRLGHALDLLRDARDDVQGEEEDPEARGFRKGALKDINKAIDATNDAMHGWIF